MRQRLSCLAFLLLLASLGSAQSIDPDRQAAVDAMLAASEQPAPWDPGPPPAFDLEAHLRTAIGLNEVDGGLTGGGPGYLAAFDERGFRMRPADGSDVAFGFRLEAVRRAGGGGGLAVEKEPRFADRGTLAVAAHGEPLEERYEVRPDGVEQSFLLRELPAGVPGANLVIRGRVTTPFAAPPGTSSDGLVFERDGEAAVRVGGVTAIDAGGRSAAGALRWDGAALELVVPGAFVESARLPLLVDPLVKLEWEVSPAGTTPDVAYDADTDLWIVAFYLGYAFPVAQRYDSLGNPVGELIFLTGIDQEWGPPSIANINAGDLFVTAYQELGEAGGVKVRSIDAATGAITPAATIALGLPGKARPQVGGDPIFPYDEAAVLYRIVGTGGEGIRYQRVTCPPGAQPSLFGSWEYANVGDVPENWRITKSNGAAGWWIATDDDKPPSGSHRAIHACLFDFNFTDCASSFVVDDPAFDATKAATAGDGQNFLLVYRTESADGVVDLRAMCFERQACQLEVVSPGISLLEDPEAAKPWALDVTMVDGNYLVVWLRDDETVESVRIDPDTCAPCGPNVILSADANSPALNQIRIASRYESSFAVADDQALVAWDDYPDDTRAAFVEAVQQGVVADLFGGCEDSPVFAHLGEPNLGQDFDLVLSEVPEGASFANLMLTPNEGLVDVGGCDVLLPNFVIPFNVDPPELIVPVPLPCDSGIVGLTWRAQFIVGLVPGEPVTGVPGVTLSNVLEIQFGG